MTLVDISGIDKRLLLKELWSQSKNASFFGQYGLKCDINEDKIDSYINDNIDSYINGYIDYFCGRLIKSDLSGNMAESRFYDRDNGVGSFQSIVDRLRIPTDYIPTDYKPSFSKSGLKIPDPCFCREGQRCYACDI